MSETTVVRQSDNETGGTAAPRRVPGLPRIGLMGEFSAGKTTLINFLLGDEILPVRVTATQMPPVWIGFGPRAAHYIDTDGNRVEMDFSDLASISVEGVRYVRLTCEAEILQEVELFDTPGISDPNIPDQYRQAVVDFVDSVIWCTHAPQAWRESERSAWALMPERLMRTSILLATRADKLNERDRGRVAARLKHETGQDFRDIILFSTLDAVRACSMEDGEALYRASGAERLLEELHAIAHEIVAGPQAGVALAAPEADAPAMQSTGGVVVPLQPNRVRPARVARVQDGGHERIGRGAAARISEAVGHSEAAEGEAVLKFAARDVVEGDVEGVIGAGMPVADLAMAEQAQPQALVLSPEFSVDGSVEDDRAGTFADRAEEDVTDVDLGLVPDVLDLGGFEVGQDEQYDDVPDHVLEAPQIEPGQLTTEAEPEAEAPVEDACEPEGIAAQDFSAVLANIGRAVSHAEAFAPEADEMDEASADEGAARHPVTARSIWQEVLADGPVETVAEMIEAIGHLLDRMERRGMIAAAAQPVDSAAADAHI